MESVEIVKALRSLGLGRGDIVLLHSSLISLGYVEGGADAVIKAFLDVIGKRGTLLVPAFGALGVIPETLKKRRDAVFSDCPVGTVAAVGADAKALCADHWKADTAHGKDTPFTRLAEKGGYICLLGVDQDRNTSLHSVEALLELPYLSPVTRTFKTPDGREVTKTWNYYPGPHRDFIGLDHILEESGAMKIMRIGNAQVRLIKSDLMFETLLALGSGDPAFALCENPSCADCVRQRAAIFAADMEKESFRLTASSRLAGRYVPEMVENLKRAGISLIELDYLQGKACALAPVKTLKRAVEDLNEAGIQVSALRVPAVPDDPAKLPELVTECGIRRVILPLANSEKAAKALVKKQIEVSFVNLCQTSLTAKEQMIAYAKKFDCDLTFNNANFVLAGEMPFLQSYRTGHFIKFMNQLDLIDCKWDGEATSLAFGNGEIKELISILRCHNFSGFFCLGGGMPYPGSLEDAVNDFRNLLAAM